MTNGIQKKSNPFIIIVFILLIIGGCLAIYFFIIDKNINSTASIDQQAAPTETTIYSTYGTINSDGQNNGYYNRFNGLTKNYTNKLNGVDLNNETACLENNGFWESPKCSCLAPFYGRRCENQDYSNDYYKVHARIYYDDGIEFLKYTNPTSQVESELYNVYPAYLNPSTPSMLEYVYYGRQSWYTVSPNGSFIPNVPNVLTPTAYASQNQLIKGFYLYTNELGITTCYMLRGIYVIELIDDKNDPDYENFIIFMKKDSQFDFAIKDKIIGVPDPYYTGMFYTPKPYFEYNDIDLNCEFLESAIDPIKQINRALSQKRNICFYPNPMIIMNGKINILKNHTGKRCPISTAQYPFGAMDTFQCNVETPNLYPVNNGYGNASQLYTKLKDDVSCKNCTDTWSCSGVKDDPDGNDTSDTANPGDHNLGGCLKCIRDYATGFIEDNFICRQLIPITNVSWITGTESNGITNVSYEWSKEITCANTERCKYSSIGVEGEGNLYGQRYISYLTPSQLRSKQSNFVLNSYDPLKTTWGSDYFSANTDYYNQLRTIIVGDNRNSKYAGWNNSPAIISDVSPIWQPCCKDIGNKCKYDFGKLETFRKFKNYYFQNRKKDTNFYQSPSCYTDYDVYMNAYDHIHLNNYRPRAIDTYNISFYNRQFFYTNFYQVKNNLGENAFMQSCVKIKLPEYTYIVNKPSDFDMNPNSLENETFTKWPQIYINAMQKETGMDEYGLTYSIASLAIPPDNPYYQSLGIVPCSTRCAFDKILSSSINTVPI